MKAAAPVKTVGDTFAGMEAYTVVVTLIKVEAKALVYTLAQIFLQVQTKSVTNSLSDMEAKIPVHKLTYEGRSDDRDTGRHTGQCRGQHTG